MKKLLSIVLGIQCLTSLGQITTIDPPKEIEVGECRDSGGFKAKLVYKIINSDTTYFLMFLNEEYTQITDIQSIVFKGNASCNDLYSILKTFFTADNAGNKDYKKEFILGKTRVAVSAKTVGKNPAAWIFTLKGYVTLTEKQIDLLFGKS